MELDRLDLRVLVVEDDTNTRDELSRFLGFVVREVLVASEGAEGLECFRRERPDVVITDIRMPVMDGLAMTTRIHELDRDALVVVTTAHTDSALLFNAIEAGVDRYVVKPVDTEKLIVALRRCHEVVELRRAARAFAEERERLVLELSASLAKIRRLSGLLPICAGCKRIRSDAGFWEQIESYIRDHSEAEFSHGICPDCFKRLYPELAKG